MKHIQELIWDISNLFVFFDIPLEHNGSDDGVPHWSTKNRHYRITCDYEFQASEPMATFDRWANSVECGHKIKGKKYLNRLDVKNISQIILNLETESKSNGKRNKNR